MKVLLLTPYSPLLVHDHAANDIALPLVHSLGQLVDLHVYAPGQRNGALKSWHIDGVTYYAGLPVRHSRLNQISLYPYSARGSWSRRSTREALALVRELDPDIVHAEYSQAAEPLLCPVPLPPTSITLHDLPGEVTLKSRADLSMLRYWQQNMEHAKIWRLQNGIVRTADAIFVRSERDRAKIASARGIVEIAPVGLNSPAIGWVGDRRRTAAFGGAMWRWENQATAVFLARDVMPLVRRRIPDAELRVFGARPTPVVCELASLPGVAVVGEVDDYDDELRRAGVTLAPAMVDAGLLMKAIRAMGMGCPVVLNQSSAGPIVGLEHGVHALIGNSAVEMAAHVVELMENRAHSTEIGEAAKRLVRPQFSWERTATVHYEVFEQLLQA